MGPDQWRELPWFERKMLLDGLIQEGVIRVPEESAQEKAAVNHSAPTVPITGGRLPKKAGTNGTVSAMGHRQVTAVWRPPE
jgi:hypothetical protein